MKKHQHGGVSPAWVPSVEGPSAQSVQAWGAEAAEIRRPSEQDMRTLVVAAIDAHLRRRGLDTPPIANIGSALAALEIAKGELLLNSDDVTGEGWARAIDRSLTALTYLLTVSPAGTAAEGDETPIRPLGTVRDVKPGLSRVRHGERAGRLAAAF